MWHIRPPEQLDHLTDVDTTTTPPDDGQALVFDDGSGLWVPGDVAAGGGSGEGAYAETIGDGVETSFVVTHGLDTTDVQVQLWDLTGTDPVLATGDADSIEATDVDDVTVTFSAAPATDAYRVVVLASGDSGGGASSPTVLGTNSYNPATVASYGTTSTSFADVDATNMAVTFTAPASGTVVVIMSAYGITAGSGTTTVLRWNLRDDSGDIADTAGRILAGTNGRGTHQVEVTDLTADTEYTFKWGHAREQGSATAITHVGSGTSGPATMVVWSA